MHRTALAELWVGSLHRHLQSDLTGLWGAGRLHREGRDPYCDPLYVDGVYFARTHFTYGPIVSLAFSGLGRLDYGTAKAVWFLLQVCALVAMLFIGLGSLWQAATIGGLLLLASPVIVYPLFAHLERGQVDLFVALGALCSLELWDRGWSGAAGVLLAAVSVLKLPAAILFLAPVAALDARFLAGGLTGAAAAAAVAMVTDGPARVRRYFGVALPAIDRSADGRLPPGLFPHASPSTPLHRWSGQDFANAELLGGNASLTRYLRSRRGYAVGTLIGALGLVVTLAAASSALTRAAGASAVRDLAWMAAIAAMLVFQPMTWVMGCVHLIVICLRFPLLLQFGGAAAAVAASGIALTAVGDPIARRLGPRFEVHRVVLGACLVWVAMVALLFTV